MKKEFTTPQIIELGTLQQIVMDYSVPGPVNDILADPHSSPIFC